MPKVSGSDSKISGLTYFTRPELLQRLDVVFLQVHALARALAARPACWSGRRRSRATPFENALLKPKKSARWKPFPYAISEVTVMIPHAMPEHRQAGAEPVRHQRVPGLREDFFEEH